MTAKKEQDKDAPERMIPTIPLEAFYRRLRKLKGSRQEKFEILYGLLEKPHGPKGAVFLAELFRRSVRHSDFYSNILEAFYETRKSRVAKKFPFAKVFVKKLDTFKVIHVGNHKLEYVDNEIFPFRTTLGCGESGKSAKRSGSGGLDLLLA